MSFYVKGRDCGLGYGYDEKLNALMPFECEPKGVTEEDHQSCKVTAAELTDNYLIIHPGLGMYTENSFTRGCETQLLHDTSRNFCLFFYIVTRLEECDNLDSLPPSCPNYIYRIDYGVQIQAIFTNEFFPATTKELQMLVQAALEDGEERTTEEQGNKMCSVMVDFDEEREMSFRDLIALVRQYRSRDASEFKSPIRAFYTAAAEMAPLMVDNSVKLTQFLTYLYSTYRKIELQLERVGYPAVFVPSVCEKPSLVNIGYDLKTAKDEFAKMDKNNVILMYAVMKKLWTAYVAYLKYMIANRNNIEEGDDIPGTCLDLQPLLRRLNTWTPVKIGNEWCDSETNVLVIPESMQHVADTLQKTTKLKELKVIKNNAVDEPRLIVGQDFDGAFGFIDMTGAVPQTELAVDVKDAQVFETNCPQKCNDVVKLWVCKTCGCAVRITRKSPLLFVCRCGSKPSMLECANTCHVTVNETDGAEACVSTVMHAQTTRKSQKKSKKRRSLVDVTKKSPRTSPRAVSRSRSPHGKR